MSLEENEALVRRYYEAANQHNVDLVVEFLAPSFVDYTNKLEGQESLREFGNLLDKGFPDLHWTIEEMVSYP